MAFFSARRRLRLEGRALCAERWKSSKQRSLGFVRMKQGCVCSCQLTGNFDTWTAATGDAEAGPAQTARDENDEKKAMTMSALNVVTRA